jgi:hypothetical protein
VEGKKNSAPVAGKPMVILLVDSSNYAYGMITIGYDG